MNGLVLRSLGVLSRSCAGSLQEVAARAFATGAGIILRKLRVLVLSFIRGRMAHLIVAGAAPSKKDVLYNLSNPDPDAEASVKAYLTSLYKGAKLESSTADGSLELTSKIEKKYKAAAIVEYGLQNISVPLGYSSSNIAPVKRYAAELRTLGKKAGFEDPATEVSKRLADTAATADSVKELLTKSQSLMSPELYAALLEAVQQIENSTNSTLTLDGGSPGYKEFAKKVETSAGGSLRIRTTKLVWQGHGQKELDTSMYEGRSPCKFAWAEVQLQRSAQGVQFGKLTNWAIAAAHGIPAKLLVDVKKGVTDDAVVKEYARYQQHAAVKDAIAELEALKADATTLLDKHLGKSAEQVRREQAAALAAAVKKAEAAKGAPWAVQFLEDVKRVEWFDACIAENPAVGPKVAA
ncbi:mitochondrial F1F0 ATP synthase associated protein [Volvox carteri f. nagariensis]|uniref:Mitochondrial F1F0 ATP synthase associated protein n=1 Tax=Volvox carteri f. nagariensis TaxID=3068 RepID=D8TQZ9_VOLCA|nr:mitochondrial F1F0 ATP synthase associated protein [Volvox carteri f. nagariensis]EFJ50249.1 mitochondrial F1F0 ATP synthase associated protein [Volvox carteri f. nagariensis]|eukprot:XP_002948869.1 mitochondrial F1F0 ATP synthase associated protein [Volvox carteri f. nagariensis]